MAKKKIAEVAVEEPVVVAPPKKAVIPQVQDKLYELTIGETPITYVLKTRGLLWFDPKLGYEREIKYCENQNTIFKDDFEKMCQKVFQTTLKKLTNSHFQLNLGSPFYGSVIQKKDSFKQLFTIKNGEIIY